MRPTHIVIHDSAMQPDASSGEIDPAHRKRGVGGICYHYLVTPHGEVVRGHTEDTAGARTRVIHQQSLEICCLGNFEESDIPCAQFDSLVSLVRELAYQYGIEPDGIIGRLDAQGILSEDTATLCVGNHLYSKLDSLRQRVAACLRADDRGSVLTLTNSHDGFIKIEGVLRGRRYDRILRRSATPVEWVRVVLRQIDREAPAWRGRGILRSTSTMGSAGCFSLNIPQRYLESGAYECCVFLEEEQTLHPEVEPLPQLRFLVDLPNEDRREFAIPPLRADIVATRVRGRGPYVMRVKGTVTNTGSEPWLNNSDAHPFRIGAMIVAPESLDKPFMELRYDLPLDRVEVGQQVSFSFTFDTGTLPLGEYYVHVDVVREGCFWFTDLGAVGELVGFEVTECRNRAGENCEHLMAPPNSWAPAPREARILYIAPTLPLFDRSTGGRRLLDMFRLLREQGVKITYLYEQAGVFSDQAKYTRVLDDLEIEHFPDPIGYLADLGDSERFNLVVLGGYSTATAVIASVRDSLPGVRIAVDSIDIHWERALLAEQAELLDRTSEDREADKDRERRVYAQADEVWVVSQAEAEILARELPAMKWRVVGIPCPSSDEYVQKLGGDNLLFVGGFGHPPNESAALWAAEIVSEFNAQSRRSIHLDIVGAQPPQSVRELGTNPLVTVAGFVPSLDLCHRNAKAFLAPLRYGGGVKGKISDAICRGVPVITNALGNEGLRLKHGDEILLGETTEDFVRILSDVYAGRYDLDEIRKNALKKVQEMYGDEALCAQMFSAIVAPRVVIGIITFNKKQLLKACLNSILEKTTYKNFKIAIVSNGCTDGSEELLREFTQRYPHLVEVIRLEVNDFFVRPCNQIIERYADSDIVLMNNDVEVVNPGWLTNLVDAAYSSRDVCGSGGLIFDPSGAVSEAGAEIYATGMGQNLCRGAQSVTGAALAIRSVGFVSGCFMYMRRDAIRAIGALDEAYHPMYFEDVAWHYTAHVHGLKTIYTPWARAVHNEGSSAGQDIANGMKRYQEVNRKKFLDKFAGVNLESFNYGD